MKDQYTELPNQLQELVRIMQWLNFGRIENIQVRDGLPLWDIEDPPRFIRHAKMEAAGMPRHEMDLRQFAIKDQHVSLFGYLDYLGSGIVEYIDVKHGLPFSCQFQDFLR